MRKLYILISGNEKEPMKAVEIKILQKGVEKGQFLKEFSTSKYGANVDF